MAKSVRTKTAEKAASLLERNLGNFRGELTIADAAARGGIALREAEAGLFHLSSEYRGHLKATEAGELVFSFPRGLTKPAGEGKFAKGMRAIGKAALGVGRFVVRAWVSVVMVGYALVFLAVMIAMALRGGDDRDSNAGAAAGFVLRIVAEALFWTFHPFSPMNFGGEPRWMRTQHYGRHTPKIPFYEKVNRFVFGPAKVEVDPLERERALIAEIRRLGGRIGPADVMRVTGLERDEAEAVLCRLVLDHDGEIDVSEEGAVIYRFAALLKSADDQMVPTAATAIWQKPEVLRPVTGNPGGTNMMLGALNGFNVLASGWAIANDLTFEKLQWMFETARMRRGYDFAPELLVPPEGTPLALGWVPFLFSSALFVLPAARAFGRRWERRRVMRENGRRALLRTVLARNGERVLTLDELRFAWSSGGGDASIAEREMTVEVRKLGGEPDVDDRGRLVYRFADLDREDKALAEARSRVTTADRRLGKVVFTSE